MTESRGETEEGGEAVQEAEPDSTSQSFTFADHSLDVPGKAQIEILWENELISIRVHV